MHRGRERVFIGLGYYSRALRFFLYLSNNNSIQFKCKWVVRCWVLITLSIQNPVKSASLSYDLRVRLQYCSSLSIKTLFFLVWVVTKSENIRITYTWCLSSPTTIIKYCNTLHEVDKAFLKQLKLFQKQGMVRDLEREDFIHESFGNVIPQAYY
ncbi:uncharacterized protein LOC133718459 [Rosa rugosa]|uniref:uncharacterized protein LOC133718459 n=1 Tax=Rosa rugosa TaxID=74645 RepID=UPI002B406A98|nr:uncharacterized protein LOC133718459 [Rosa rugosa]